MNGARSPQRSSSDDRRTRCETVVCRDRRRHLVRAALGLVAAASFAAPIIASVGVDPAAAGWQPPKSPPAAPPPTTVRLVVPSGATFRCKDGTYSFVKSATAACWGHGGVEKRV